VIRTFADKSTAAVFGGMFARRLPRDIQARALTKLRQIDAATALDDLRRICFRWRNGDAWDVEIADYH
jgi:proteic killer suppression protein